MSQNYHKPDYLLIGVIFIIIVFGLVMLSSASSAKAVKEFSDSYYYLKHQLFLGFFPGLVFLYLLARFDYRRWQKLSIFWLVASFALLLLPFIPGLGTNLGTSSKSWIDLGFFTLQPSEIVKLTFILYLANWFANRKWREVGNLYYGFLPFVLVLILVAVLVMAQPDIGTMSIIVAIALAIYFSAGASLLHLFWLFLAGAGGFTLLIKMKPYRVQRLLAFLNPGLDPQGIGYHINQALLAIGSGGWLGRGLGQSRQKFDYLPEMFGDSIFAVIAEELGFIMVIGLIILFIILMYRGLRLADRAPDMFGRLLAIGIVFWFVFQALVNIGAMAGLLPLTGLPLPFISYGGTALMTSLAAAGILINISRQTR
ncbi:MAG: putative lipid II flippase FtsW [bacterium]